MRSAKSAVVEIQRATQKSILEGVKQIREYLSEASGFYEEGYLGAPFLEEGKGVVSFDQAGELLFTKADAYAYPLSDVIRESNRQQLLDVEDLAKQELLKNLSMPEIIDICGSGHNRAFQEILERIGDIDLTSIGELVIKAKEN